MASRCREIHGGDEFARRAENEICGFPRQNRIQLGAALGRLLLLLLLLSTALLDNFAKAAGMLTVEGHADGFRERIVPGITDHHGRPCRGLQQRPMQAQGKDQQRHHAESDDGKHRGESDAAGGRVNYGVAGRWWRRASRSCR